MTNEELMVRETRVQVEDIAGQLARIADMAGNMEIKSLNMTFSSQGIRVTATTRRTAWIPRESVRVY